MYRDPEASLSPQGHRLLDRRGFLKMAGGTMGSLGLLHLLERDALAGAPPIRVKIDPANPFAPRPPHYVPQAKRLLIIFCVGAVSHVDTFDYKPALFKFDGKKPPGIPDVTFQGATGNVAKPFWKFRPRGKSGKMVSDLLPHLGGMVDDMTFLHALSSTTSAHPQAENFLSTGFTFEGFPSIGSWLIYALGSENQNLPAYVAINDPRGKPRSGKNNWGAGFLPAAFQGTDFTAANPPRNLARPPGISADEDRSVKSLLARLNGRQLEQSAGDSDLAARIASYELAGRMQMSIPEATAVDSEPEWLVSEYGADSKNNLKREYARNCILARRLLERGVRVVHLFNGSDASGGNGISNWDSHNDIEKTHAMQAEIMDQPTAALLHDLTRRGLMDDTLVLWCTEFGRMPFLQANGTGRDHNPDAFTSFFMGAGIKPGMSFGESDDMGFKATVNATSLYDLNATVLHLLGLNHERLTYYHNGIERRLTNVHGRVIDEILA